MNDEVAQKKVLFCSGTKMQLGSECHPGNIGLLKVKFWHDTVVDRAREPSSKAAKENIMEFEEVVFVIPRWLRCWETVLL